MFSLSLEGHDKPEVAAIALNLVAQVAVRHGKVGDARDLAGRKQSGGPLGRPLGHQLAQGRQLQRGRVPGDELDTAARPRQLGRVQVRASALVGQPGAETG